MTIDDDIKEVIQQLSELQVQQTTLIARLQLYNERRTEETRREVPASATARPTRVPDADRDFVIGDWVRIKKPRPHQENIGYIIKYTKKRIAANSRVSVYTASGDTIVRAQKTSNCTLDHE
jgi:putative ribosome biogenesis GTPase RsgA